MIARDGDRVVIEDDARVEIVRRRQGMIRSVFNPAQRLLIVLVDYQATGSSPDGQVDVAYQYRDIETWPLGERWEGYGVFEEYLPFSQVGSPRGPRFGLVTPQGALLLEPGPPPGIMQQQPPPAQNVFFFRGSSTTNGPMSMSLDQAEQAQLAQAARDIEGGRIVGGSSTIGGGVSGSSYSTWSSSGSSALPAGAVRAGGPVRPPQERFVMRRRSYPNGGASGQLYAAS